MPRPEDPRPTRTAAILDVLTRAAPTDEFDLFDIRDRVDEAQEAGDTRALREALVDEAAAVIVKLEALPHPSQLVTEGGT